MAEEKDIALLADNDIIVEIEVQEAPTVVIDTISTTTAEISGDSALGIVVGALPTLAKEATLNSAKEEILTAVENIELPEIDTTNIASKDLERFFGVKPIEGYEFMTAEEVCSTLEDIMTAMDLALTPQQAQEITNNTLTN